MDFVFGTLATDELKLVHHRVMRRGVQHQFEIAPRDPLPEEPVLITVRVGQDVPAEQVTVYYTTDGSIPEGSRGIATQGTALPLTLVDYVWDTLAWGYIAIWQGILPAQGEHTLVTYRISAWSATIEVYGDYPEFKATTERAAAAFFRGEPVPPDPAPQAFAGDVFNYSVDRYQTPHWVKQSVIYQVFVDRFYPGEGRNWSGARSLTDFHGGTLWGVRDQLDYLQDLGIDCLWLTPTFVSPSYHGYDITDYYHVEARLGGDEAMRALISAAHARGIRVILDLVCNHISSEHPIFQAALNDPASPYRDWFVFDPREPIGYKTFFGVANMPYLNLQHPDARDYMLDVARYWLREFDVDGYRLDHANGPGPAFWTHFQRAVKTEKADAFCFGEIVEAPDVLRQYIGRLDGLLDFHLEDAFRNTFAYGIWSEAQFDQFSARHQRYFPDSFVLPTFLDNHDMDRFLYAAKGDQDALKRAAIRQMALPHPPIIYYGTEVGLTQTEGKNDGFGLDVSRLPMRWGTEQDTALLAFYKALIAKRKVAHEAL